MKTTTFLISALVSISAIAQEEIPLERAQRGARLLYETASSIPSAVRIEPNLEKPHALKAGELAALIIPDQRLTKETLAKAGAEPLPVGQLWLLRIAPASHGKVLAADKLQTVQVSTDEADLSVQRYALAAAKQKDEWQLLVYGKGKEPVLRVPLKKHDGAQVYPLELQGRKETEESGILSVSVLGERRAEITIMKLE